MPDIGDRDHLWSRTRSISGDEGNQAADVVGVNVGDHHEVQSLAPRGNSLKILPDEGLKGSRIATIDQDVDAFSSDQERVSVFGRIHLYLHHPHIKSDSRLAFDHY